MFNRLIASFLIGLVMSLNFVSHAQTPASEPAGSAPKTEELSKKDLKRAKRTKDFVKKLGLGPSARTEIRLEDNTILKGFERGFRQLFCYD